MPQTDMESSSGLIMSLIRIVKNSKDDAERDVIKKKLEDYLAVSDEELTKLVIKHQEDLRFVVQNFTIISTNLEKSLGKLIGVKQRLKACREMLTSKLDELAKLSQESIKNEKILILLDRVEELSNVPYEINELLNNGQYLDATKLLTEKQEFINENFESFDCLKDLKNELDAKCDEMYRSFEGKLLEFDSPERDEIVEGLKLMKMTNKTTDTQEQEITKEKLETAQPIKHSLFKFSRSSHAICFNEHYKEMMNYRDGLYKESTTVNPSR